MPKLVLLDIDGTLIRCGKVPRNAIIRAMEETFGTSGSVNEYPFSGKTDPQIVHELMKLSGIEEAVIEEKLPQALEKYAEYLGATLESGHVTVLAGVDELLQNLAGREGVTLGLLTGNMIKGAKIKLDRAGLLPYFGTNGGFLGAFGSDASQRDKLPPIAVERARENLNITFAQKQIVVIGDSPHDVTCGRSLNVCSVAVATGWHSIEDLETYNPDFAYPDLSATQTILDDILSA